MTLVGSQTSGRSWVGCTPVSVVKQTNGANVNWGGGGGGGGGWGGGGGGGGVWCFCAIQEINFLYTLHDFHQIIENINNTIFF